MFSSPNGNRQNHQQRPGQNQAHLEAINAKVYATLASLDILIQHFKEGSTSPSMYQRQLKGLFRELYENIQLLGSTNLTPGKFIRQQNLQNQFPHITQYLSNEKDPALFEENVSLQFPMEKNPTNAIPASSGSTGDENELKDLISQIEQTILQQSDLDSHLQSLKTKYRKVFASHPHLLKRLHSLQRQLKKPLQQLQYTNAKKITITPFSLPQPSKLERITKKGAFLKSLKAGIIQSIQTLRNQTGGIIALSEFLAIIRDATNTCISISDLRRALEHLKQDRLIPGLSELASKIEIVELSPLEISSDQQVILSLASTKGWTSLEEILLVTHWTEARTRRFLERYESLGIAHYDTSYKEGNRWYFPGFIEKPSS